jgi:hypothetical protein
VSRVRHDGQAVGQVAADHLACDGMLICTNVHDPKSVSQQEPILRLLNLQL